MTYCLGQGHTGERHTFNQRPGALTPGGAQFWGGLDLGCEARDTVPAGPLLKGCLQKEARETRPPGGEDI